MKAHYKRILRDAEKNVERSLAIQDLREGSPWHGAFSLCLLIKTLFAGDIVPLLYAETDKSKRSVKNKKPVRINTKTIDRRHAG